MQKPRLSFWQIWNMSFGWGLQMANMSSIYGYLGANPDKLVVLWLTAPVSGVIIQPLIGQTSLALVLMPKDLCGCLRRHPRLQF